jgi:hypothetical protein
MLYCEKMTPRRLCEAIEEYASVDCGKLARRPFNRFKAIECAWWLVPSAALPFYHHGKLYFDWADKDQSAIACGFFIEKGLAPEVAAVYPSKKGKSLIMNDSWQWNRFRDACADNSFFKMLRIAAEKSKLEFELHVRGGYVDDPGLFDPYNDKLKQDHFIFDLDPMTEAVKYRSAKRDAMVLKVLNKVKNFVGLRDAIIGFDADHFLWLNVFLAVKFRVCPPEPPPNEQIISSKDIWSQCLSAFAGLIK